MVCVGNKSIEVTILIEVGKGYAVAVCRPQLLTAVKEKDRVILSDRCLLERGQRPCASQDEWGTRARKTSSPSTALPSERVLASELTNRRTADCPQVLELLNQVDDPIASVRADGAYDAAAVYEAAQGKGCGRRVRVIIPPSRGAQPSSSRSPRGRERNRNIRSMRKVGRREWYAHSGYSR